jgi:type II secretory pathway predicted ATPase ExeA
MWPALQIQEASAMYDGCFGLDRRPFGSVPEIDSYFPASAIDGARATLARSIQRGEGTGLVIGPSGTGKTLLCLLLAEQFRRSFQVVMLQSGRLSTRRALFQSILYELGRPYRGLDEGEARLTVVDYLMTGDLCARGILLLVDEAHTLPLRLLEDIRLMTNLVRGNQPLVRLVLTGGPSLEEHFASPKLDSFSQRLSARCYLEALNRTETEQYIQSQIKAAGGCGDLVFPSETCQSVFQATGGVPRLINQVCDHALLLAYVAGRKQITPANVEEAWGDLQQLPTPWNGESKGDQTGGGVIEFGSLDEQADATPGTAVPATVSIPALRITPTTEENESNDAEPAEQIHRIERLLAEADDDFQPAGSIGPEMELRFEDAPHPFQEAFEQEEVVADRYAAAAETPALSLPRPSTAAEPEEQPATDDDLASLETFEPAASPTEPEWELVGAQASVAAGALIGDQQEPLPYSTSPPSAPVTRREYRQLFARLRRG